MAIEAVKELIRLSSWAGEVKIVVFPENSTVRRKSVAALSRDSALQGRTRGCLAARRTSTLSDEQKENA